ncbi:MAG: macro domain-containing protein [Acidimicrobiales bacterium]|nr:macro domain-containing protein [Acidimicrobiales bacterium]
MTSSYERTVHGVVVELVEGDDIAAQAGIDAVVNAANAQLVPGGGVAGALHRAAGPGLAEECAPLAPIRPGECVVTGAHRLPNRYVIHCLGPVHGRDEPADDLLSSCYRSALELAEQQGVESVAVPAISTGVFGYPVDEAAEVALAAVTAAAAGARTVRRIRFVLRGAPAFDAHRRVLERLAELA